MPQLKDLRRVVAIEADRGLTIVDGEVICKEFVDDPGGDGLIQPLTTIEGEVAGGILLMMMQELVDYYSLFLLLFERRIY